MDATVLRSLVAELQTLRTSLALPNTDYPTAPAANGKPRLVRFAAGSTQPLEVACDFTTDCSTRMRYKIYPRDPLSEDSRLDREHGKTVYIRNVQPTTASNLIKKALEDGLIYLANHPQLEMHTVDINTVTL